MKFLSLITINLFFFSGLFAQLASVDADYKTQRIQYLQSELNLTPEQVKELTIRFKEIVPEETAEDWKKTRMAYEQILLEVLNINQKRQLGETYGFNRECTTLKNNNTINRPGNKITPKPQRNSLALAPNPTSDYVTLSYEIRTAGNIAIELKDEQGQAVMVIAQGYLKEGNYSERLDLTQMISNVYFVTLRSGNDIITEKLILQK